MSFNIQEPSYVRGKDNWWFNKQAQCYDNTSRWWIQMAMGGFVQQSLVFGSENWVLR